MQRALSASEIFDGPVLGDFSSKISLYLQDHEQKTLDASNPICTLNSMTVCSPFYEEENYEIFSIKMGF